VVSARSHVFTDEQLANLNAIAWLYRGEQHKFIEQLARYQNQVGQKLATLPERLSADQQMVESLIDDLAALGKLTEDNNAVAAVRDKLGEEHGLSDELLADYRSALADLQAQHAECQTTLDALLHVASKELSAIEALAQNADFAARKAQQNRLEAFNPSLKIALAELEARHKAVLKLLEMAEKTLRARQWSGLAFDSAREAKKALLPRDLKKREKPTVRDLAVDACKRAGYFIAQGHWLLSRFPHGLYEDVLGLCKAVTQAEIAANDYSLTPGRYVGVALSVEDDDEGEAFRTRMMEIHSELAELNEKATGLAAGIQASFAELFE